MKHRTHKLAAKTVATILCAALMLTACGSKETTSNETANTETTPVESTTEATVAEPTAEPMVEPTVEPTEAPTEAAPTETPAESPAPAVEPTAEPVVTETTAADAGYTYSEVNQTMYAKSAVNVRDLPSTDGKKIGSLKSSQEITVTGKCDQTGWYRFDLNGTTGYVSDKYIVSEKPVVNTVAATGNSNTAGNQYASNTETDEFGISDAVIENFMKTHGDGTTGNTTTGNTSNTSDYFDRAAAEQVFASVNAERTAAGIPALTWSEDLYNIAVQRCYEDDGHTGMRAGTSENYTTGGGSDAARIHQKWHDSEGHYNNYMNSKWTYGAVAVRICYATIGGVQLESYHIAYEVFSAGDNSTATNSSVTINTPVQDDSVAAAPKTADEDTSTSSSNVGWSMTPPTQEDGLKKWQEQNPDVEVSFGN